MTHRCFSSSMLYALRNEIGVQMLIEKTLHIPCRVTKGCFRFLCPLCNRFDTAVNPKTNLARCFHCEKNFNTIDLVMAVRQADFVNSVKFLQSVHQKDDQGHNRLDFETISATNRQSQSRMNPEPPSEKCPHSFGEILDSVLPPLHGGITENCKVAPKSNKSMAAQQITVEDRIVKLEQKIRLIDRQIKKIAQTLDARPVSK